MSSTVRLAWLSDAHLPFAGFPARYWTMKRVLGWLNWQRKRRAIHTRAALDLIVADLKSQKPDHILVSGDLINLGLPLEYAGARAWLDDLGPPDKVSVVPGNHDIYVDGDALGAGLALWRDYLAGNAIPESAAPLFPTLSTIGPVAVIGVNSAVPTAVGFASGLVGTEQLDRLEAMLTETKARGLVRLVMIHHPPLPGLAPPRRALVDAEAVAAVLARAGADLVIHGHNHTETCHRHAGIPVVGGASASTSRVHGREPMATYHLITIGQDGSNALIEIVTRSLDMTAPRIVHVAIQRFQSDSAL